jgi:NAD(P)-dependent dehydrogenase (short-subunit alcohol dehydrogenase family)
VVSGGGTGIGRAIARDFAAAGDRVVIVGRRRDVLERAAAEIDGEVVALPADLTDAPAVERLGSEIAQRFPQVDVLVNNAGGTAGGGPAQGGLTQVAERWTDMWRANVLSAVLLIEALKPRLASPGGRVLLLSSIAAYRGANGYGSAKAALHPYAYDLAAELGPRGITVNVIAPGYIQDTEFFGDRMTPERRQNLIAQTSTGRPGTPDDIATTVRWLASPEAGQVTAQIIQVNGGAMVGR